jgi:hypothetical protein
MKAVLNQPISVSLCAGIELMDGYQKVIHTTTI